MDIFYNFGHTKFAFDMAKFAAPHWEERRRRFYRQAATLPGEIVMAIVAVFTDEDYPRYGSLSPSWGRLSAVCRTWSNIFRPLMFQIAVLEKMSHYHHFRNALYSSCGCAGSLVSELDIQPVPCQRYTTPGLPFVLASMSWRLQQVACLSLRWLEIINWTCDSLSQLFRIIRAIHGLEILRMTSVDITHNSRPLCWPASLTRTPPHLIEIDRCDMSDDALTAFLKLGLCGRPNLLPASHRSPIKSWSVARAIHFDDATAVVAMHETFIQRWKHSSSTHTSISLEVDSLSDMTVSIILAAEENSWYHTNAEMHSPDDGDLRLRRIELRQNRAKYSKTTLKRLDRSLWESSRRSRPPLRFSAVLCADKYKEDVERELPQLMPQLYRAGRVSVVKVDHPSLPECRTPACN
ncbi:hypothetical protein PsYK624_124100 [Phanerochaete sordida]|uniref:F-box domain-containing protein n=1 Tax=Phanerochaete sordida TaxID=48140 RepID=A0A9P3GJN9_9APHY|nr:hypothetical protein PsYK624_124100 [Phanerochaete sordida]